MPNATSNRTDIGLQFQDSMIALIRALGLHQPDQTPCGQPVAIAEAHTLLELSGEPGLSQNGLAARLRLEKSSVSGSSRHSRSADGSDESAIPKTPGSSRSI